MFLLRTFLPKLVICSLFIFVLLIFENLAIHFLIVLPTPFINLQMYSQNWWLGYLFFRQNFVFSSFLKTQYKLSYNFFRVLNLSQFFSLLTDCRSHLFELKPPELIQIYRLIFIAVNTGLHLLKFLLNLSRLYVHYLLFRLIHDPSEFKIKSRWELFGLIHYRCYLYRSSRTSFKKSGFFEKLRW